MDLIEMSVERRRFVRACAAGLSERTALVEVSVQGAVVFDQAAEDRMRSGATILDRGEPLYGVADGDWPNVFLMPGTQPSDNDDDALRRLGDWVVALTVAIQRWGRLPVWRGRVLTAEQGRLSLAIPWQREPLFDRSLEVAPKLIPTWLRPDPHQQPEPPWFRWLNTRSGSGPRSALDRHFCGRWEEIQDDGLPTNTMRFIEAAARRGMPFDVLHTFVQIGWGANAERFDMSVTGRTGWIAMLLARNKLRASQTLELEGVPVPPTILVGTRNEAMLAADQLGWPVVVKPLDRDGAEGVTVGIRRAEKLAEAFGDAQRLSPGVLVEKHCPGEDHRLLVVRGRVLQVVRRLPARVFGDGARTVSRLVDQLNADPRRGTQPSSLLRVVVIDAETVDYLAEQGLVPDSVPPFGEPVWLSRIANISAGGTAEDVTAIAHPDNVALAVRAARIIGLDVAGVDFLCPDISRSWRDVGGVICEVNGQPGFRPHWLADPARDINGEVLDILLDGRPTRIPTAAISGTNGKTTTTEMLYRIWTVAGRLTGVCTSARVRIGDHTVTTENLSGQPGARIILNDPGVEAAVLEMPRKGLIYFGHPCDRYDVAALLNVQDDHIGVDGIDTIEQMAELKAEILERATEAIVVNAEDPLCLAMRERAGTGRHILVARSPDVDAVADHRRHGGEAVFLDDRCGRPWIVLARGDADTELMPVHDIPATLNGLLPFNETNALFAAALAWAQGIGTDTIRAALGSFSNSVDHNPGRYNFIEGLPFELLVDFAHNPDGVRGICSLTDALPVDGRRLLCSLLVGTRHSAFLDDMAPQLASSFDEFVLSCDFVNVDASPDYLGDDPTGTMLARYRAALLQQGVDAHRITCEADREAAIGIALDRARPGDLVVLLAGHDESQRVIQRWRAAHSENRRISQPPTAPRAWDDEAVKRG